MIDLIVTAVFVLWVLATLIIKEPIVVAIDKFWYSGITIGWLILVRKKDMDDRLVNHEYIHAKQQKETLLIFGYLLYLVELICKSIYYRSIKQGYYNISFEREARLFSGSVDYSFKRKPYNFRHFIICEDVLCIIPNEHNERIYQKFKTLQRGDVFVFKGDFDSLRLYLLREKNNRDEAQKIRFQLVDNGSDLQKVYGKNTCVVL